MRITFKGALLKIFILLIISMYASAFEYQVHGNYKTKTSVVDKEIKDLVSKEANKKTIAMIKRRLWNLRLFSKIKITRKKQFLKIEVEERWTLIPIAKFSSGGGSSYYALGAYDINFLGNNTEVGAQYENLNGFDAGVAWFRKPQFLKDRNLTIGMDIWSINRVRRLFTENGEENGAFTLKRNRINSFIEKRWKEDFYSLGVQVDQHLDRVFERGLSDEQKKKNTENSFSPDEENDSTWWSLYGFIGRLNYVNYLVDGNQLSFKASHIQSNENYYQLSLKYSFYHQFKDQFNSNFAFQLLASQSNINLRQYQNYVGGLSEVRAYEDGQFFGKSFVQANVEQRFDVFQSESFVTQGAVFVDAAGVGKTVSEASKISGNTLLSSGVGLRFISPKIFRFVARLDYAQSFSRYQNKGISFGIQQFF